MLLSCQLLIRQNSKDYVNDSAFPAVLPVRT